MTDALFQEGGKQSEGVRMGGEQDVQVCAVAPHGGRLGEGLAACQDGIQGRRWTEGLGWKFCICIGSVMEVEFGDSCGDGASSASAEIGCEAGWAHYDMFGVEQRAVADPALA